MSILFAAVFALQTTDSTKIVLSTSEEDNYFMCPVLTPRLTERLIRDCECEVITTEEYELWVYPTVDRPFNDDRLRQLIDIVGFDTTHVFIRHEE